MGRGARPRYGGVGGDYLKNAPVNSYKYVGFFFALVVGSALLLWILFQRL